MRRADIGSHGVAPPRSAVGSRLQERAVESGGRPREGADPLERPEEVSEERVVGGETQHEPAAGATDAGGDGDEAEAQPLGVASPLALGQGEQLQPAEQVVGDERDQQVGPVGVEAL